MNYMVIINDFQIGDTVFSAKDIVATLFKHRQWLFSPRTAKISRLKPGDKVIVYAAGKGNRCFIGSFCLESVPDVEEADGSLELIHLKKYFPLSCRIKNILIWSKPVAIKDVLDDLSFIGDKKNYGLYLRQGMRELSEQDYSVIVGKAQR